MRIGHLIDMTMPLSQTIEEVQALAEAGYDSAWLTQTFGPDALTALAVIGNRVEGIDVGTAVVPVYARHPMTMAQQALTVQAATGGRLILGIGLSHQIVVENIWGYSYDRPARFMREYLDALIPMLAGETVNISGEVVVNRGFAPLEVPGAEAPPVLVAALGEVMLKLAGRVASGTVTWMTGTNTIGQHIAPTITAAAKEAGRPAPRIVVSLPVTVTNDVTTARERINEYFAIYPGLPSYKAMLDREGTSVPADISLIGSEEEVAAGLDRLTQAGATEFVGAILGTDEERAVTTAFLATQSTT
jgi:5,10-methylenetetrahydromethanopterin reductase